MGSQAVNLTGSAGARCLLHRSAPRKDAKFVKSRVKLSCKLLSSLWLLFTGGLFTAGEVTGEQVTLKRIFIVDDWKKNTDWTHYIELHQLYT